MMDKRRLICTALWRGLQKRCPHCGVGPLFSGTIIGDRLPVAVAIVIVYFNLGAFSHLLGALSFIAIVIALVSDDAESLGRGHRAARPLARVLAGSVRSDSQVRFAPSMRAAILYAALTLCLAFPLSVRPGSRVMSASPDTNLFMWTLAWDTHAFTHQPLAIFDANIYYPERHTLAYSENLIGSAFFAAPVLWLTGNLVLAMNLVALLSCVLCGLGAYVLARRVGIGSAGAVLAGLIFAFSPPRFFRLDQLHLTTIQWVPFGLASLHGYLDDGRRRDLWCAAGFFTLQALTSGHGAVFLAVGALGLVVYRVAMGEPVAWTRRLRDAGAPGLLLLLPAVLLCVPYLMVQREMGLRRSLENWAVSWSSFAASPSHLHAWLLSLIPGARINETADAYLFPGYLPVILALVGAAWRRQTARAGTDASRGRAWRIVAAALEWATLVACALGFYVTAVGVLRLRIGAVTLLVVHSATRAWIVCALTAAMRIALAWRVPLSVTSRMRGSADAVQRWRRARRRDVATFYALLTLLAVWLSVGPPIGLWPLVYWLPGMNFIRVPSRFMLLAVLGIAVLAGIGFERLTARASARTRVAWAWALGFLMVAGFNAAPLDVQEYRVELPAIDRWLDGQSKPFVIAEVPLADPRSLGAWERRHTTYMLHSTAHWQKTVEGYSGIRPALHVQLYDELTSFPDERSVRALNDLGVTYVVVHTDLYEPGEWPIVEQRIAQFQPSLTLEHVEGAGRVYALHRGSAAVVDGVQGDR